MTGGFRLWLTVPGARETLSFASGTRYRLCALQAILTDGFSTHGLLTLTTIKSRVPEPERSISLHLSATLLGGLLHPRSATWNFFLLEVSLAGKAALEPSPSPIR